MILYRPVGLYEMEKILDLEGKGFPARFEDQPIFYPVLNAEYARQIAEKWNQKDIHSGYVGYVTEFIIDDEYIKSFEIHQVGTHIHKEYWIPAEELEEFNRHIIGSIKIAMAFYGRYFVGILPSGITGFVEKDSRKQIDVLKRMLEYNSRSFNCTVFTEWKVVNLNFFLWCALEQENSIILGKILSALDKKNIRFIN